jgi:glycosyltransferase involved in cell wall biosynthesis
VTLAASSGFIASRHRVNQRFEAVGLCTPERKLWRECRFLTRALRQTGESDREIVNGAGPMPQQLRVSVALCTHNGQSFIGDQIRSILRQSYRPFELVISDDASTDSTLAIAENLTRSWNLERPDDFIRVRIIRNDPPLGVAKNFEGALRATTGELVALCDQDDVWHDDKLAIMVPEFDRRPDLLLLHSDAVLVDENSEALAKTLFETLDVTEAQIAAVAEGGAFQVLLRRNLVTGATVVLRRSLVAHATPFPVEWLHDEWLAMIAAIVGKVDIVRAQTIDYRLHGNNQVGASTLTLSGRISRMTTPRGPRNARLLDRANALVTRILALDWPVPSSTLELVEAKAAHEKMRSSLPASRIRRVPAVLTEARTGSYSRFGGGLQDIVRDLVQPAGS